MLEAPIELATELPATVTLRRLTSADAEVFAAHVAADGERLLHHLPWWAGNDTVDGARTMLALYEREEDGRVVIAGAFHDGRLLGGALLFHHVPEHESAELGVWTLAEAEGTGLARAACEALIRLARTDLGVHRLEWRCSARNQRSRALAERLGFRLEGTLRAAFLMHGERHDTDILSLVGHELE